MEKELINKKRAAELLGVTTRTIDNLMRKKELPFYKMGWAVRFDVADIEAYKEKSRQSAKWEGEK